MLAYPYLGDQVRNRESKRTSGPVFLLLQDLIHQHLTGDGITCGQKTPSACSNKLVVRKLAIIANQKTTAN